MRTGFRSKIYQNLLVYDLESVILSLSLTGSASIISACINATIHKRFHWTWIPILLLMSILKRLTRAILLLILLLILLSGGQ